MDNNTTIIITPSAIVYVLAAAAILLVIASTGSHWVAFLLGYGAFPPEDPGTSVDGIVRLLSVNSENNIPTYFSTFLLIFSALLLAVITVLERRQANSYAFYWAILSAGFFFMAADELLSFHERLIKPVRRLLGDDYLSIFHYAWVIPYMVLVLILGLFFLRFLWSLTRKTRLAFLMAATLFIGGAVGCEIVGAYIARSLLLEKHMMPE